MKRNQYFPYVGVAFLMLFGHLSAQSTNFTRNHDWPKADKKFYLDIHGGYGFHMGGGYNGLVRYDDVRIALMGRYFREKKELKSSISEGWQGGLNFGFPLNRYITIEIGVNYIKGGFGVSRLFVCDTIGNISLASLDRHSDFARTSVAIKSNFQSNIGGLSTSVRISPGFKRWDPYLRMGINIMACVCDYNMNVDLGYLVPPMEDVPGLVDESWGGYGRVGHQKLYTSSIGFIGAFGLDCKFTPTISMFTEWQFTLMTSTAYRDRSMETNYAWGNEAYSPVLDRAVGRYVRNDFVLPFSNTGLNLGIKFSF